jgi:hypothetical protein
MGHLESDGRLRVGGGPLLIHRITWISSSQSFYFFYFQSILHDFEFCMFLSEALSPLYFPPRYLLDDLAATAESCLLYFN